MVLILVRLVPGMLKSVGVQTVILGHSERRAYFNETDALLAKKVDTALGTQHACDILFWRRTGRS